MNIKLVRFLAVICAGLCLLIVSEWLFAIYANKQLLKSIEPTNKVSKSIAQLPTIELAKRPETSYTDLVVRPLFIQGRKPVAEVSSEQITAINAATETFNWELNGVYTYQNKLYALMSRTTTKVPKDNFRKVTRDNEIDGWKIIEIKKDKVIVNQGGKQKELLLRKAKPKVASNNTANGLTPPLTPNQPGQPLMPGQQQIPVPEPIPVPEQVPEPELIPDESSETYFDSGENDQFQ